MNNDSLDDLLKDYENISIKLQSDDLSIDDHVKLFKKSEHMYKKIIDCLDDTRMEIENIGSENV